MKRQDTVLSSSSRRENVQENHHSKSIGCMSGIFQLVGKYQHRRKFLTFGKKQEKNVLSPSPNAKHLGGISSQDSPPMQEDIKKEGDFRRLSCEVPRSPTLPAEIRWSNSVNSMQNSRSSTTPPALVPRLMGLEGIPAAESAAEKRRKLLGALEKCDEDLKELKKIIESVKSSVNIGEDHKEINGRRKEHSWGGDEEENGDGEFMKKVKRYCAEFNSEQPSPVSVLDEFTRSPLVCSMAKRHTNGGRVPHQQIMQQQKKKPGEEDLINLYIFNRFSTQSFQKKNENAAASSPLLWSSKAMIESVEEACRDIAWGEKREVGRIGLVLQDQIYRDLIEEFIREMGSYCMYSLPFEACKRRLCF